MDSRPRAQTSKQAKAAFKKYGPQISEDELRRNDRAGELERRAEAIRERERKRKEAQKQRAEREQRERNAKIDAGFSLATQLAGLSHSQHNMKKGMEAFLGLKKSVYEKKPVNEQERATEVLQEDRAQNSLGENETAGEKEQDAPPKTDPWDDDDLDEDSLLDIAAQETIVSGEPKPASSSAQSLRIPLKGPVQDSPQMNPSKPPLVLPLSQSQQKPPQNLPWIIGQNPAPVIKTTAELPKVAPRDLKSSPKLMQPPPIPYLNQRKIDNPTLHKAVGAIRVQKKPPKTNWNPPSVHTGAVSFLKASVFRQIPQREEWDDFLDSSTQIARDISASTKPMATPVSNMDLFICTQDLDMSLDDLDEIGIGKDQPIPTKSREAVSNLIAPQKTVQKMSSTSTMHSRLNKKPVDTFSSSRKSAQKPMHVNAVSKVMPPPPPPFVKPPIKISKGPVFVKEDYGFSTQDMHAVLEDDLLLSPG